MRFKAYIIAGIIAAFLVPGGTVFPSRASAQLAPPTPGAPRSASPTPRRSVAKPTRRISTTKPTRKQNGYNQHYAWFWDVVSPDLTAASPARWAQVETLMVERAGTIAVPDAARLLQVVATNRDAIQQAAADHAVSPALVLAVIWVESAGRVDAVSTAGAGGLMQLMPVTASRFGVNNRFDGPSNIAGGTTYLRVLLDLFDQDAILALAAYNAGENAVLRRNGVPPFAETRDYVPKVMAVWLVAKSLCVAPPKGPTGPCVFKSR